jgi:hypothetical protein
VCAPTSFAQPLEDGFDKRRTHRVERQRTLMSAL